MAEERKSWESLMAEELIGEAINRVVPRVEDPEDDTSGAEMLAATVEEVRLISVNTTIRLNPHLAQVTVSETAEVPEAVDPALESVGAAAGDLVVEDRDEEARLRKGGLLRDKAMASTAGVRDIQLKLDGATRSSTRREPRSCCRSAASS